LSVVVVVVVVVVVLLAPLFLFRMKSLQTLHHSLVIAREILSRERRLGGPLDALEGLGEEEEEGFGG